MKKRLISALLASCLCLSLAACANDAGTGSSTPPAATNPGTQVSASGTQVSWPDGKDVYIDIGARAGGGTDLMVRYMTTPWTSMIDGNMVVNNYDTAEVGVQHAKNAKPDGLTLTVCSTVNMDNYLTGSSEVNPTTDFVVVGKFTAGGPQALVAKPDAPFDDLQGLAVYAKDHPGELVTGVALGATSHLVWLNLVKTMGGVELNYVQSGGEADKLTNIATGSLDLTNCSITNARAYEEDGKLKILGIVGPSDSMSKDDFDPTLSDAYKTTWEQGYTGASWQAGSYLCAPAGTDPALLETIYESMKQVENDATFQEGMAAMGQIIEFKGPSEAAADFMAEWEVQVALTTELGINVRG